MSWRPQPDGDGLSWGPPAPSARLVRAQGGWRYQREGEEPSPLLPKNAHELAGWQLQPGDSAVVARLDPQVLLLPGARIELWLGLPMALILTLGPGGPVIDTVRPTFRRTLLGAVDRGLLLPSASARMLDGPEDPSLPETFYAARVLAYNGRSEPAVLRRVPVFEPALTLWRAGDRVAAGDVSVTLDDEHSAEARVDTAAAPPGFTQVSEHAARPAGRSLSWLHDAARHRVEFQA